MSDNGYVMSVHADCAKYLYQTQGVSGTAPKLVLNIYHGFFNACIYIYIYTCIYTYLQAGRYMFNLKYTGICCYLTCISLHLPI